MKIGRGALGGVAAAAVVAGVLLVASPRAQFVLGGALVNLGYGLQDHLQSFDLSHSEDITPDQILEELRQQNSLSAWVRSELPRSTEHPVIALLVCMDARIDTSELVGDTRRYYYVIRTAGSVLGPAEQEMLELAVHKGVKLLVLTTHTDCAAETVAADPALAERFPAIAALVTERAQHIADFLARPLIKQRIAEGKLRVEQMLVDTDTESLITVAGVGASKHAVRARSGH